MCLLRAYMVVVYIRYIFFLNYIASILYRCVLRYLFFNTYGRYNFMNIRDLR
ncbi:hypothetical protein C2G38_2063730 [Gigaspora rosea]|uniref:Uncharacterized protein n=1 Tax=Gigaspora rosea TaxID=44941 RepID=A0A397VW73_9GLOM|nr:hypothetical protein C2G38_2063730 [Gigaspora rosea]